MGALAYAYQGSFSDRVAQLLDIIDCYRVESEEEKEEIYRLRYNAYLKEGAISPCQSKLLSDKYDEADNVWLFGLYIDGELASSIRMHVAHRSAPTAPGMSVFPDFLSPEIDAGKVVLDPTRFVTDARQSRRYPTLPYATLRLCWMAADYFDTDHFLATVRAEHQNFYRRTFCHETMCTPRPYPSLTKPICLMTVNYASVASRVLTRYPFFRSSYYERRMLFERADRADDIAGKPRPGLPALKESAGAMQAS